MDILVLSSRSALWESLMPAFAARGASVRMASTLEEGLDSLRSSRAVLVVLDLALGGEALRKVVFQILSIDAMIHTAALSDMSHEEFHDAMEGLGMLAGLPMEPSAADVEGLMDALAKVSA